MAQVELMKQPQPDARERKWQDQCRSVFPQHFILHHCRERNTKYVTDTRRLPIGHIFINILHPLKHPNEFDGIHADPERRDLERRNFEQVVARVKGVYGKDAMVITDEEIEACLSYR